MWVLLLYIGYGCGGGPASIDGFTSYSNCQKAETEVIKKFNNFRVKTLCIKKD